MYTTTLYNFQGYLCQLSFSEANEDIWKTSVFREGLSDP